MWISRIKYETIKRDIKLLEEREQIYLKREQENTIKYHDLLNHLGLVEWIEAPKDAAPAKTILITKKEQKKRNKNKIYSYPNPVLPPSLPSSIFKQYQAIAVDGSPFANMLSIKMFK